MSSRVGDPSKAVEANKALEAAQKELKTTMFKWAPDHLAAEPLFQQAGRAFKSAGLHDSAVSAWKQAAQCSIKSGNPKQAITTLDNVSREITAVAGASASGRAQRAAASALLVEAANLLVEVGELPRAADYRMRAGKLLEGGDDEAACALYATAGDLFGDDHDKDVYAKEALSKVLAAQLNLSKHASAMKTMDKLAPIFVRLSQPHNVNKMVLSRIVLLLGAGDAVAAQRDLNRYFDIPGFSESVECGASEDLINTYEEMNASALTTVINRNVFNYLDHNVARVAKALPKHVLEGTSVTSKAGESATSGITYNKTEAVASVEGLPAGFKVVSLGGSGLATAATDSLDPHAKTVTERSKNKEDADRAALFGGGGGGGGGKSSNSNSSSSSSSSSSSKKSSTSSSAASSSSPSSPKSKAAAADDFGSGAGSSNSSSNSSSSSSSSSKGKSAKKQQQEAPEEEDFDYESAFKSIAEGGAEGEVEAEGASETASGAAGEATSAETATVPAESVAVVAAAAPPAIDAKVSEEDEFGLF